MMNLLIVVLITLKKQIGELELNAQEDEFKQTLINSIENKIQDAVVGDFKGYALDEIIAEAGNVASDPRVIGRLRAQQQYKTYHDNLNARTDLSEDYKNYYRQVNTYHYEDKLDAAGNIIGGTEWKPEKQEVSEVPASVIYNEALKIAQADAGGGESYSFLDVNGNPTSDYTKSATGEMFMKSGNKWERLSEDKLQHAIDAAKAEARSSIFSGMLGNIGSALNTWNRNKRQAKLDEETLRVLGLRAPNANKLVLSALGY